MLCCFFSIYSGTANNLRDYLSTKSASEAIETVTVKRYVQIDSVDNITEKGDENKIQIDESWSACLLVNNENLQLPEWLAYHYQVLPLRRIIVGRDPRAKTDPRHILKQFEAIGLEATVWDYDDYFYRGGKRKRSIQKQYNYSYVDFMNGTSGPNTDEVLSYKMHLWRQLCFLDKCKQQLRDEGRSWMMAIDADEFLTYNSYTPDEQSIYHCGGDKVARQNCIKEHHVYMQSKEQQVAHIRNRVKAHKTVSAFINESMDDILKWDPTFEWPCWVLPRFILTAHEPDGTNRSTSHLNTLRFRTTAQYDQGYPGKSIANLQAFNVSPGSRLPKASTCHKVFETGCRGGPFAKYEMNFLRVHHYTGSLEDWLVRGKEASGHHERQSSMGSDIIETDEATWWWPAFREQVGTEEAIRLTKGLREWAIQEYQAAYGKGKNANATLLM
jgi:hypothetical protein